MIAVVINREDRPERLRESQKQFDKYGMEVGVFPAITQPGGWRGCRDSHLAVLEKYKNENFLLVFEDDILFISDPMPAIAQAINELPPAWDMLYLGISPSQRYLRVAPHLFKVNGGYTTHAIIWNNKPGKVIEYILNNRKDINKWDVYLSNMIHRLFSCFVIYPLLCTQRETGQTDTCKHSDVSTILTNYNKFCK